MTQIDAIYQNGMFKPLQAVTLAENQRVRLSYQQLEAVDIQSWLSALQEQQKRIIAERGYFPDSAASIAEDAEAMSDLVVDSNIVAKWIIGEPDSAQAQRLIPEVALQGGRLIVLDLAFVEVANAIWKLYHRGLATLDESRDFLDQLLVSPVHVEPANRLLKPALEIATRYDRSLYDALFVALAKDLGLRAVTADEPLFNAVHADFPEIILLRNW